MIDYGIRRRPIWSQHGVHDFGIDCAACADPVPLAYVAGIVYGEDVVCCSGLCLAQLYRVWAPSKRAYPIVPLLVSLLLMVLSGWR